MKDKASAGPFKGYYQRMDLRFPENELQYWADRYKYQESEAELENAISLVQKEGFLTFEQLEQVCRWKAPRSAGNMKNNEPDFVEEVTGISFSAKNERTRIEVLTLLDGVRWPTASVILHFFHVNRYPIMDFRALWSVREEVPSKYDFKFWWEYVIFSREVAERNNITMRLLDKALWQYSKEHQ